MRQAPGPLGPLGPLAAWTISRLGATHHLRCGLTWSTPSHSSHFALPIVVLDADRLLTCQPISLLYSFQIPRDPRLHMASHSHPNIPSRPSLLPLSPVFTLDFTLNFTLTAIPPRLLSSLPWHCYEKPSPWPWLCSPSWASPVTSNCQPLPHSTWPPSQPIMVPPPWNAGSSWSRSPFQPLKGSRVRWYNSSGISQMQVGELSPQITRAALIRPPWFSELPVMSPRLHSPLGLLVLRSPLTRLEPKVYHLSVRLDPDFDPTDRAIGSHGRRKIWNTLGGRRR